jgi:2-keto-4-pentenoate hydratase/2-oxohepta-3-ene-1,7-dioic acid hydratase in catechol pathway
VPKTVRLFRVAGERGPRLVLEVDGRGLDLTRWLDERAGRVSSEVLELLAEGFFEGTALERALATGKWHEAAPGGVALVPIEPERVGKILALGKNFREHAAEFGEAVPEEPLFFDKLPETLVADGATIRVPPWYAGRVDHEAELAVVIGAGGRDLDERDAMRHVAGYAVADDLTLRTLQGDDRKLKYPWFRSKNFDGSCPLGPCLVPRDFLDAGDVRVRAKVLRSGGPAEGEPRQDASTRDLIVSVPRAVSWISRHLTLRAGDVILMGTPAGVGPLSDGDEVVCEVSGIGELRTRISRPRA